jgi:serine protease DegS/serine protease DegQ
MRRATFQTLTFILRFAILGLAIAFVISLVAPSAIDRLRGNVRGTVGNADSGSTTLAIGHGPVSYGDAVTRAAPAVVNIYAN